MSDRPFRFRLGALLTLGGILIGATASYVATVVTLSDKINELQNELSLVHAYSASVYFWALSTSAEIKVPPPDKPSTFMPISRHARPVVPRGIIAAESP